MPVQPGFEKVAARLLASSVRAETGCLRWTGSRRRGYGRVRLDGRWKSVHVLAHQAWIGPVPAGLEVDHVYANGCRYTDCFEPSHLEAVTHLENNRRRQALLTHCPKGHDYTPENIRWSVRRGYRYRKCRTCFNAQRRARRAQIKAESGRPPLPRTETP